MSALGDKDAATELRGVNYCTKPLGWDEGSSAKNVFSPVKSEDSEG